MRRARHLKPETFPFLAVLLCAMGALILLLLVMDRRAKAVARAKAAQAVQVVEEHDKELEKRRAEQQQRLAEARRLREQAAEAFREEERKLNAQLEAARRRAESADADAQITEARLRELRQKLEAEQNAVQRNEEAVQAARQRVEAAEATAVRTRDEAKSLADELERLEKQLVTLKDKRQRERQTYSLIPYRGKRGDNRKPLYLECGPNGLVFHPDRTTLEGADLSAARLREEVQKRVVRLGGRKDAVYLFFLVRPDGIGRYYDAVASLTGFEVDFGYELVEKDWVFDFTESSEAESARADTTKPTPSSPASSGVPGVSTSGKSPPRGVTFGKPEPPATGGTGPANRQPGLMPGPVMPNSGGGAPRPLSSGILNPFVEEPLAGKNGEPTEHPPIVDTTKPAPSKVEPSGEPPANPTLGKPEGANAGGASAGPPGMKTGSAEQPSRPRVVGTRELVFRIECKGSEVILYPGGGRFDTSLVGNPDGPKTLARTLEQMIARRQSSVRPGEAAYRPQVRFLVRPDGLRSFFLVYPLLEPLGVPMTRQDLQDDDELP